MVQRSVERTWSVRSGPKANDHIFPLWDKLNILGVEGKPGVGARPFFPEGCRSGGLKKFTLGDAVGTNAIGSLGYASGLRHGSTEFVCGIGALRTLSNLTLAALILFLKVALWTLFDYDM